MESEQVKGPPYYLHGKSNSAGVCIFFHSFFFFFFFWSCFYHLLLCLRDSSMLLHVAVCTFHCLNLPQCTYPFYCGCFQFEAPTNTPATNTCTCLLVHTCFIVLDVYL